MVDTQLRAIREGAGATREDLVRRSQKVSIGTIRNAERVGRIRYSTAVKILEALNSILEEKGQKSVALEDLGLTLF